jgi:predicted homoserine dehydrogenase-like protein
MTTTEVEVVAADDCQPGETLATIQTRTTIQVWTITQKRIERGKALPLVAPLHQLDMSGWDPNPKRI